MTDNETEYNEFEAVAIARDLMRKPDVRILALAIANLMATPTRPVHRDNIPPLYLIMANRLLNHPVERKAFLALLDLVTED